MERYLINALKNNSTDPIICKYIDFFKIELDWFIYNYGDHIATTHSRTSRGSLKNQIYRFIQSYSPTTIPHSINQSGQNILSSLYFSDEDMRSLGITVYSSIFQPVGRKNIIRDGHSVRLLRKIRNAIKTGVFTDLYSPPLFYDLEAHQRKMVEQYRAFNLRALCLFTDQYFESKYLIDIFRELNRPSMIFSHGLPGIYSPDVDHRSDYLMVWGEKIKENYINFTGMSPDKIKVVGNIKYRNVPQNLKLRNSLDDVLVIPVSSVLWHQHEWGSPKLVDRSMIVLYLYQVQHVLQSLGVKNARFRPHPSINSEWVYGFIDKNFYKIDRLSLPQSLSQSSLVIGATSTTFLETLMSGVNYVIYEPLDENRESLTRIHNVPPFDGSVKGLEIATDPTELRYLLKSKYMSDPKVLDGYMQPLDLSVINKIIQ